MNSIFIIMIDWSSIACTAEKTASKAAHMSTSMAFESCLFVLWLLNGPSTARSLGPTFGLDVV